MGGPWHHIVRPPSPAGSAEQLHVSSTATLLNTASAHVAEVEKTLSRAWDKKVHFLKGGGKHVTTAVVQRSSLVGVVERRKSSVFSMSKKR